MTTLRGHFFQMRKWKPSQKEGSQAHQQMSNKQGLASKAEGLPAGRRWVPCSSSTQGRHFLWPENQKLQGSVYCVANNECQIWFLGILHGLSCLTCDMWMTYLSSWCLCEAGVGCLSKGQGEGRTGVDMGLTMFHNVGRVRLRIRDGTLSSANHFFLCKNVTELCFSFLTCKMRFKKKSSSIVGGFQ